MRSNWALAGAVCSLPAVYNFLLLGRANGAFSACIIKA